MPIAPPRGSSDRRSVRGSTAVQTFARPGLSALRPGVVEADGDAWGAGPVGGHLVAQPALPEEDRSRGGGQVDEGAVGLGRVGAAGRGGHHQG